MNYLEIRLEFCFFCFFFLMKTIHHSIIHSYFGIENVRITSEGLNKKTVEVCIDVNRIINAIQYSILKRQ